MGLIVTVPATVYPVSLVEAKAHCRVDSADEDTLISSLIAAAVDWAERYTSLSLANKTLQLIVDDFSDAILLPRGPVQSVSSFVYDNADGVEVAVPADIYTVDLTSERQWLIRNSGESWPTTLAAVNVVRVTYTTGFSALPDGIKHALLLLIGQWFDNRSAVTEGNAKEVPFAVESLLRPHRMLLV